MYDYPKTTGSAANTSGKSLDNLNRKNVCKQLIN
jgi:hypothetical protein